MRLRGRGLRSAAGLAFLLSLGCRSPRSTDAQGEARLLAHVRMLASEIGPRPAGGPEDRRAQEYILRELEAAGLEVKLQEFERVRISDTTDLVLRTANVIGILPGRVPGALLVGAHHDSRNALCPGASDDASGVAVVLEAARILARRTHRHTLVFASFGGEESMGLPGSGVFLKTWSGVPLRLAVTLDFVGSGKVFVAPFPVPPELWANRLLARAATELKAPRVSFDPWLVTVPRLLPVPFFADHASFLAAGVPALNLSCQFPAWSYHTPEDRADRVEGGTLLSARDLVVKMISQMDALDALPRGRDPGYSSLELFGRPVFLASGFLQAATLSVALLALLTLWRWRREILSLQAWGEGLRAVLVSVPLATLAVSGAFLPEAALRAMKGVRHPWYAHPGWHLAGSLAAAAFTTWLSLALARFIRPTNRPGAFLAPAILWEGALAAACVIPGRMEVALPFLMGACGMLLAAWSQSAIRRGAYGILGLACLLPYLSPTTYRMFLELSGVNLPRFSLEMGAWLLSFPWLLFLQGLSCSPEVLHTRPGGPLLRARTGSALALVALALWLLNAARPAYDRDHRVVVDVEQEIDSARHRVEVFFSSRETLRRVRLVGDGGRRLPDVEEARLRIPFPDGEIPSLEIQTEHGTEGDLVCRVRGSLPGTPRWISLRFEGRERFEVERDGSWQGSGEYRRLIFPTGASLEEKIRLRPGAGGPITLETVIGYEEDLLSLRPAAKDHVFRTSARVRASRRLP